MNKAFIVLGYQKEDGIAEAKTKTLWQIEMPYLVKARRWVVNVNFLFSVNVLTWCAHPDAIRPPLTRQIPNKMVRRNPQLASSTRTKGAKNPETKDVVAPIKLRAKAVLFGVVIPSNCPWCT